ncbi:MULTISPECIES: protein-L-isoaspartate(D-aspartate) O-methyltransferase [Shewanella]|jgi:protein-L-isoaspartate(D-aspartate) O-methyltransferase|uniref:Protein-L-isoaspartate O-methyltransferase n=1 Tax=Shewanella chilikensis TaxID=558541 RepID=A0A6G7LUC0_9GAMM|nr:MULTISPECIES: protein-L-isoaspartate(D-aspartate) O-methyltransferase [Shewanella]MCA0949214.1 protein-L-isoaspartate(D-aspartate) O-methyltransferase [Shewanella chilikensis]MCE9853048.1 protein-L-isoaspartate(D-aspartate) O-methyltransferase [Shewanella chilikensis]MCL1152725.1 protein-L-isoaspartate(D-aspartate) O-methyltransferase [Shewanella chilikensis]MCL1161294.1 protein-L-isoaspartate(D-aspartate) O-methyltransferase [Shewanella chilikensis]PYE57982.1 protein-L-isoaspartate(D-aspar
MTRVASTSALNLTKKLQEAGIRHPGLLQVVAKTPRELFLDGALAHKAYENTALPIGSGQTISQPYIVARMTELLLEHNPAKVLEIGTGSGYQAAVLAQLVPELFTVERIKSLQIQARQRLKRLDLHNVHFKYGDGWQGWPNRAPFDAIMVTAAASDIPAALLEQLAEGGVLVIPVGDESQQLLKIRREKGQFISQVIEAVKFVPLISGGLA